MVEINKTMQSAVSASESINGVMTECTLSITQSAERAAIIASKQATVAAHKTAEEEWKKAVDQITASCRVATDNAAIAAQRANEAVRIVFGTVQNAKKMAMESVTLAQQSLETVNSTLSMNRNAQREIVGAQQMMQQILNETQVVFKNAERSIAQNSENILTSIHQNVYSVTDEATR